MDNKRLQMAANEAVAREKETMLLERTHRRNDLNGALIRLRQRLEDSENHLRQLRCRETESVADLEELLRKRIFKVPGRNRDTMELWTSAAALDAESRLTKRCSTMYADHVKQLRDEESTLVAALEEIDNNE